MNIIEFLQGIDRRIIFIIIAIGVILPLLIPWDLSPRITDEVRSIFLTIEDLGIQSRITGKDKVVMLSFDYDPSSKEELNPIAYAVMRHCFSRNIKVVIMGHWPNYVGLAEQALRLIAKEFDKVAGDDYVFLGYKPGGDDLILRMGQDFQLAWGKDTEGRDLTQMKATKDIKRLADLDYMIDLAAGASIDAMWVPFAVQRYGIKMGGACTAVIGPDMYPFLDSKQINGLISGLAGAAEYEFLIAKPMHDPFVRDWLQEKYPDQKVESVLYQSSYAQYLSEVNPLIEEEVSKLPYKLNETELAFFKENRRVTMLINIMELLNQKGIGNFDAIPKSDLIGKELGGGFEGSMKQASIAMNSQNIAHLIIIFFILVGNVSYFIMNYYSKKSN